MCSGGGEGERERQRKVDGVGGGGGGGGGMGIKRQKNLFVTISRSCNSPNHVETSNLSKFHTCCSS